MTVAFCRNKVNKEVKKIGKFSKEVVLRLKSQGIRADIVYEDKRDTCLNLFKDYGTLIIIAHGDENTIYHKYHVDWSRRQPLLNTELINKDNQMMDGIKDKKIIAISCRTARNLGKVLCNEGGCKAYLGFNNSIHFDKLINRQNPSKRAISGDYHLLLTECYDEVFSFVFEKAISKNWTFSKTKEVLFRELKRVVTNKAISYDKVKSEYYRKIITTQAIIAITNVAENIELFGDAQEVIA